MGNEKRLRSAIFPLQRQTDNWLRSSVGQSTTLLIWGSWVRVPAESPTNKGKNDMKMFRQLYIRWLVRRGKAIDIWSHSDYPSQVLSNLCSNPFTFDGVQCGSMEGFLQSLKQQDLNKQRQICAMKGRNAKRASTTHWQTDQIVWWKDIDIDRQSDDFLQLVCHAYQAMFDQSERFRAALMATRGMRLYHSRGKSNPFKTILTEQEFCHILTDLRDKYDERDKGLSNRRLIFVEVEYDEPTVQDGEN